LLKVEPQGVLTVLKAKSRSKISQVAPYQVKGGRETVLCGIVVKGGFQLCNFGAKQVKLAGEFTVFRNNRSILKIEGDPPSDACLLRELVLLKP